MNWKLTGMCLAAVAWMVPGALGAQERPLPEFDKSQAVQMLRSGDMAAIFSVAHRAAADMTFGGPGASPQLRAELVSALERAAAKEAERLQRGGFATEAEGEVRLELVAAVGRLGDPSTIPLLADVLADFSRDCLADFGELALDDVLRVVQDPDSPDGAIREGLTALRFMVEDGSLRAASLDRVRTATRGHLERPRNFAVLGRAAQLGFVLGDSEFVALVESFAEDPEAIITRGITTARSIEHVQKTLHACPAGRQAAQAAAGDAALPAELPGARTRYPEGRFRSANWWRGRVTRSRRFQVFPAGGCGAHLARQKAFQYRKMSREGGDPRWSEGRAVPTFAEAAEKVIALYAKTWKGSTSEKQWRSSLKRFAYPRIGAMPVNRITTRDVMDVLEANDFWHRTPETARRVRQRIGAVMKWAIAQGHRLDNPSGDAIGAALPRNGHRKEHFRSLPHAEVAAALAKVRDSGAWAGTKLAIEFMVLTASRPGETRLATWEEVDFDTATWTIPETRAKTKRPHRVPLSPRALEVLTEALAIRDHTGLVFPSVMGKAAANVTYTKLLRELEIPAVSHGFRSSFRVWCGDTGVDREVAERALAHTGRNPVEAAYARGSMFERRRGVMTDWSAYVSEGLR